MCVSTRSLDAAPAARGHDSAKQDAIYLSNVTYEYLL